MMRLRLPNIQPLELWDLQVPEGGILWDHAQTPDFGTILCAAMGQVWQGAGVSRSDGPICLPPRAFDAVHLTGGGALTVREAMRRGPWARVEVGRETVFAAAPGGFALLAQQNLAGWVLDVGQSALKICSGMGRWQKPRDWGCLPLRQDNHSADLSQQRQAMRHFIASFLSETLAITDGWPQALVAGLPCRLGDDGIPEGSSYIGMAGDAALLPDAMRLAGMPPVPLWVLNDAELAAYSAMQEPAGAATQVSTLVLTLGFGVGAALIRP